MATVERDTWSLPPVFRLVGELGRVPQSDLERTLNLGVGMVAVVDPAAADTAVERLASRGITAWVAGQVADASAAESVSAVEQAPAEDHVQGAKGVDGGAVLLTGAYATR